MGQNFIADTANQTLLFSSSLHDWLAEGHLARFLLDVVSALDLSGDPTPSAGQTECQPRAEAGVRGAAIC